MIMSQTTQHALRQGN